MNDLPPLTKISEPIFGKQWDFYIPPDLDNLSDFDKMCLIRNRKQHNRLKAKKFFGSELKIDVSLSMIERIKLPAILESDLPLAYFLCYLIKIQGCENLFFIMEVHKFKETHFESEDIRRLAAVRLFNTFMEPNQAMQINAKAEYIACDKSSLSAPDSTIFDSAYHEVYSMLHMLYMQFESDEMYKVMISELAMADSSREGIPKKQSSNVTAYGSIYPLRAYHLVLDRISYTLDNVESFYEESIISKRRSVHRRRILRRSIHAFCEQRLQMDFCDTRVTQSMITEASMGSNPRSSMLSVFSNTSEANNSTSSVRRKDALDFF